MADNSEPQNFADYVKSLEVRIANLERERKGPVAGVVISILKPGEYRFSEGYIADLGFREDQLDGSPRGYAPGLKVAFNRNNLGSEETRWRLGFDGDINDNNLPNILWWATANGK